MWRSIRLGLLLAGVLAGATVKLYMKDGTYHIAREYKIQNDRVSYFSTERGEWEELPLELVDLKKTETEAKAREESIKEDVKAIAEEEKFEREREKEIDRVPKDAGVYFTPTANEMKPIPAAEVKFVNNKRRSVLKVMSPIPIVAGETIVELDGLESKNVFHETRPEFFIRLSQEERFTILKLTPLKNVRIVEKLEKVPVAEEIIEKQEEVEIFRQQLDDGLYKIWPTKPLPPGQYAVAEYTTGKGTIQVWDFSVK